ncbi:hypothetical protein FOMG_17802 [Fusarium oxysporum f. sp. melonis 26406]|uniref:Uncharacterized protein n=1 Tax=Fusarium oxysporum f. sp. melonis 26406 TaxID=1089452 RepID=W9Z2E6_FUSOX|nr:hypothetical protein FOMG_17802 [Fusarium oxysporum f. sp. melonis 26406]
MKTANKLGRKTTENTIENPKSTYPEAEIQSLWLQKQHKADWSPRARYPTRREIIKSKEARLKRLEKQRKMEAEKKESRKIKTPLSPTMKDLIMANDVGA